MLAAGCGQSKSRVAEEPSENSGASGSGKGGTGEASAGRSTRGGTGGGGAGSVGQGGGNATGGETAGGNATVGGNATAGANATGGATAGENATGGVAMGGNAMGGVAALGGRLGQGGVIELPTGCRESHEFVGAGEWSVGVTCGLETYLIDCYDRSDSVWSCRCGGEGEGNTVPNRYYVIETPSAHEAAAVTAFVCTSDDPEFSGAPESCAVEEDIQTDSCRIEQVCTRSKVVWEVSTAFEYTPKTYSCQPQSTGGVACRCGDLGVFFTSEDFNEVCGFAQAYCESATPTPVGMPRCGTHYVEAEPESCVESATCEQDIELDDGTVTTIIQGAGVRCGNSDAEAVCECSSDLFWFNFPWQTEATTCSEALDLCLIKSDSERQGSYDCEVSSESVYETNCETLLTCLQPATIGSTAVDLRGTLGIRCNEGDDASTCTCFSSQNIFGGVERSAEITVASNDAATACTAAQAPCRDAMEVVFPDEH